MYQNNFSYKKLKKETHKIQVCWSDLLVHCGQAWSIHWFSHVFFFKRAFWSVKLWIDIDYKCYKSWKVANGLSLPNLLSCQNNIDWLWINCPNTEKSKSNFRAEAVAWINKIERRKKIILKAFFFFIEPPFVRHCTEARIITFKN